MSNERTIPGKSDKHRMQTTQQIIHNLLETIELFPQYTVAQHLAFIIRRKDPNAKELYFWKDEELLKKVEQHKEELENELVSLKEDGEDINID